MLERQRKMLTIEREIAYSARERHVQQFRQLRPDLPGFAVDRILPGQNQVEWT
jgi:hypothetical protein